MNNFYIFLITINLIIYSLYVIMFDILRLLNKDNNKRCIKIKCIAIPIIIVFCIFSLIFCIIADLSKTLHTLPIHIYILFMFFLIYWGCNFTDILPELKKKMKKDTKNGKNTHGFHNI